MRRKPDTVLALEAAILTALIEQARAGTGSVHGFELAKRLRDDSGGRKLTAHGTLYKALSRMEDAGWLTSTWEDPDEACAEGRPRRRLYSITADGRAALARAVGQATDLRLDPGWSTP
ncbi:MAG TPA: PadR family transcriptional regulator [Acidimicrobiales bacterium]|nr:PadR family transcriptional regulator [Acidimicrobiales bacterium]